MGEGTLPTAKSARSPDERDRLRRVIQWSGLCGLANDTKWDEFIAAMRSAASGGRAIATNASTALPRVGTSSGSITSRSR